MQVDRRPFYEPGEIVRQVKDKIGKLRERDESIDYITFVPDGEPTLDINLGREIELLKSFGYRIAVITNSSLIWREDVRTELNKADWVSLKLDSVDQKMWRKVNRPYRTLQLNLILDGVLEFARGFKGELATETMLVKGLNDSGELLTETAEFIARLNPAVSYVSIPTRPPAEEWVNAPDEETINRAYQIFKERIANVEYLIGYEGNAFAFTGNAEDDILSITSVHPMREDAVEDFLKRAGGDWDIIYNLIAQARLLEAEYEGKKFYIRKLGNTPGNGLQNKAGQL
jgi:wyosine [tRNA(Phe)-imidazoG37] synthetase (radical SAM superfamily)